MPLDIVLTTESRFRRKKGELLVGATVIELSVSGAAIQIASSAAVPTYSVGSKFRFRLQGMDGLATVRHVGHGEDSVRLGVQLDCLPVELERLLFDILDACRRDGSAVREHWENAT